MTPATLTRIREELELSSSAMARAIGISRESLRKYEAGSDPVPLVVALAVTCYYRRLPPVE